MPAVTVRNLPAKTHRALKLRAARNGRSTETEIRLILEEAVTPKTEVGLGSQLAALGRRLGGLNLRITRDSRSAEPARFS
jgi:antitoxin FitA